MADSAAALTTPDGRYIVVRERLWRRTNPRLSDTEREALTRDLMDARRDVGRLMRAGADSAPARAAVNRAKIALGERGPVWWGGGSVARWPFRRGVAGFTPSLKLPPDFRSGAVCLLTNGTFRARAALAKIAKLKFIGYRMPRYFFEADDGSHRTSGDWLDLDGPAAVREAVMTSLPDMFRDTMPDGDERVLSVTATDDGGAIVYEATLTLEGRHGEVHGGSFSRVGATVKCR